MNIPTHTLRLILLTSVATCSACQSMKMPGVDLVKSPEFSEEAANIPRSYPRVVDAPIRPVDIRSDEQWDEDAKKLQKLRESFGEIALEPGLSDTEVEAQFEQLKAKAQAYKLDDPIGGVNYSFPDIDPRPRRN